MARDFGTRFMPEMTVSRFDNGQWSPITAESSESISVHPGAHVLHYASTCFEGLKAFRHADGSVKIFRMDQNIKRFSQSSELLCMPSFTDEHCAAMINQIVDQYRADVPEPPASMYIRPTHIGLEPAIGKAAEPSDTSLMYILLSPVGDYFTGGEVSLRLLLDDVGMRCGDDHGMVKGGGNYASAMKHIQRAIREHNAQQVLFCSERGVSETGAANFLMIDGNELITRALDDSFLHGVTRDSVLTLARDNGMTVSERDLSIDELLERAAHPECEAALAGTAAVLAAVGTFIYQGKETSVGNGQPGPKVRALREQLNAIQWGQAADPHGWLSSVG